MAMEKSLGNLFVRLGAKTDFSQAEAGLKRLGDSARRAGGEMTRYLTLPILGFGALTLKNAGDFESAMNQVRAVSGATGSSIDALTEKARELGATTQYSASQAADAMSFLAMAGFDANEILGAIPGTLELAAAAQLDLAESADIVSNILTGYRKDVSELAHVNDVLVKAFTRTNTSLAQLGEAMKYAGPIASAAGVGFEEATAAIGLMGNAGIQATMAGTALRGAISQMLDPTDGAAQAMRELGLSFTDAHGRLLPFDEIIQQLEPHADDAGLMMELFGLRAGPAMAALVSQGSEALRELTGELENSAGTASEIASVQMEGFNGKMRELMSAVQELMLSIADSGLLEWATDLAGAMAEIIRKIADTNPKILAFGTVVAGIAAATGPALIVIGHLSLGVAALGPIARATAGGIGVLTASINTLAGSVAAILAIPGAVAFLSGALFFGSTTEANAGEDEAVRRMWERHEAIQALKTALQNPPDTSWLEGYNAMFEDGEGGGDDPPRVPTIPGLGGLIDSAEQDAMQARLEQLRESLMTEEEAAQNSFERRLADLAEFHEARMLSEQEYHDLSERAAHEHADRLTEIEQQANQLRHQMFSENLGYISSTLQSISSMMGSEGDKQIGIQKAISVAIAAINVAQGISKALTLPFPANLLAAASTAAAGFAQIAAINNTSKGSPSMAMPSGGGASAAASAGDAGGQTSRVLHVSGLDTGQLFTGDMVRMMAKELIDFQEDGGRVILS